MKLWQKICICVVVLFIIGFDVSAWLIIEKSTAVLIEQETEIALTDQRLMESSLAERLTAAQKDYETLNADNLAFLIQPYAQYYADQRTYFKVYLDDKLVYGSFKAGSDFDTQVSAGQTQYALVEITGTPYLRIASRMDEPFSNIRIVYLKNEQQIQDYRSQISRYCVTVSVIVSVALAAVVVALLLRLTSPLRKLNEAAREISAGDYHREVKVDSRDEVGELAESFNVMSEHVRAHIEELSKLTEAKQRFIDDLAHELRTPLTAIVGYGEALRSAQLDDEERDMALNYIVSQGERIQNLSTKLIDLAWLGSSQIDPEEVDLAEVFRSVAASVRGRCE
ncbi:MAG: HAMP domain-containing histidine kinase, partial [Actinomycetia bacterium]|nr:HAMP domain-containing histidine kinase [Actinomycetes bacterium]